MPRPILFLFASLSLLAQSPAVFTGKVRDSQGLPIEHATVKLIRQSSTESARAETDSKGVYRFDRITPGDFVLEIEKGQFRREIRIVHLTAGAPIEDVTLAVRGVDQTVQVTASGGVQLDSETSKAVSVIGRDEILNRDAVTLGDIVRFTPGIQVDSTGGIGQLTSFKLRGLREDAAAILIDGMRFRDATGLQSDASSFISSLNFINADSVEVLRGSGSSIYGTNAVGGAVNIVTPQGGGPTHGDLQLEGGSLGLIRTRGSLSGGALGDRLKYTAGLLYINMMSGVGGDAPARSIGGQGFVRYDLTPKMSLTARLLASNDFAILNASPSTDSIPSANIPASGIVNAIPLSSSAVSILNAGGTPDFGNANFEQNLNDPDSRRASQFASAAFVFRDDLAPRFNWQASYQKTYTNRAYDNGPAGAGYQPTADDHSQYTGNIDTIDIHGTALLTRNINLTGGYEFERESYADYQNNNVPAPNLTIEHTRVTQNSQAGYFASQISLLNRRLQISVSGRLQAFFLSQPNFQFTGTGNSYAGVPIVSPPKALTGDASVAYTAPHSSTKFRAHFGNAYRAPSLYERFGGGFYADPTTGIVSLTPYGDPRLAPDRYNSVDGGIDQYLFSNRLKVSATYFYTRIVHVTAFDFSGIVNPVTDPYGRAYGYINGSGGISRGAEISIQAKLSPTLTITGSYAYVNEDTDQDQTVTGLFKAFSIQPHTATIVATKHWNRKFSTTADVFHGSSYYTPFYAGFSDRAYRFPGFTKAGLTADYRVWQGEHRALKAYVRVDNLLNETYYFAGWQAPKLTAVTGLGYSF